MSLSNMLFNRLTIMLSHLETPKVHLCGWIYTNLLLCRQGWWAWERDYTQILCSFTCNCSLRQMWQTTSELQVRPYNFFVDSPVHIDSIELRFQPGRLQVVGMVQFSGEELGFSERGLVFLIDVGWFSGSCKSHILMFRKSMRLQCFYQVGFKESVCEPTVICS